MAENLGYYKGVLLCSRPGQSPSLAKEKPFVGRVYAHDSIGLVPTKKYKQRYEKKRVLPVLNNHKKWLQGFKKKIVEKKEEQELKKEKEAKNLEKIKQEAHKARQNHKISISQLKNYQQNPEEKEKKSETKEEQKSHRVKNKNEKPAWAKTQKQMQVEEDQEVDELLNFFESGEIKDYLEDEDISKMLTDLKQKIDNMKNQKIEGEGNWKKKKVKSIEEAKQKNEQHENKKEDILSKISRNSVAQSITSQKTADRIKELQQNKQQKGWDKNTKTDRQSCVSIDEKIAKNVADEILRNYPALKHHSNQSIRQLLQKKAHQQIKT